MGNSAGVSNAQHEQTPSPPAVAAEDRVYTPIDDTPIDYDSIPIDYSESPTESRMSGRISQRSDGGTPSRKGQSWCPHDRYFRRHRWYTKRRAWPRASERDQQYGYQPHLPTRGMGREDVMPELDDSRLQNGLHVTKVDLHLEENTESHHTVMYQCTGSRRCHPSRKTAELVIRRGQEFLVTLTFNQHCDVRKNDVTLVFNLGDDCKPNTNLNATVRVDDRDNTSYIPKKWGATCVSQKGKSMTLAVYVPASAPVGEWEFSVTTVVDVRNKKNIIWQYNHNEDINIIFNPWCRDDWVYINDEKWRTETVLNDSGVYYHGSCFRMAASPWFYGQFEDGILEAAFHLLRKGCGYQAKSSMANPASVTRLLADTINADNAKGVIAGEWTGDYSNGTAPTKWKGSDKIIRRYMATGKPVRYGQCWVFAGLLTTLCRSLGIPSRCVTNYSSGHNTDTAHLSIDYFNVRSDSGEWMEVSDDSIWSFHVWSEVWMMRPDLDSHGKYDGWQAVDPTPLQHSDGVYCSGPCPVQAIKDGELGVHHDVAFMFGQVNADKVIWREDEYGSLVETKRLRNLVGKMISTHEPTGRPYRGAAMKAYGGKQKLERLDLTSSYKYEEGSKRERMGVQRAEMAFRLGNACLNSSNYYNDDARDHNVDPVDDIRIDIAEIGDVFVGSGFQFKVHVYNKGSRNRHVRRVFLKAFYKTYFGITTDLAEVRKFGRFELGPNDSETFKMEISSQIAAARPQDGYHFDLRAIVELGDRDYIITETMPFLLRRPNIRLAGPTTCGMRDEIEVEVMFANPLSVALTDCEVDIEGSLACLDPTEDNYTIKDIKPKGVWKTVLFLKPKPHPTNKKLRDISVVLESAELRDIIGYYAVTID